MLHIDIETQKATNHDKELIGDWLVSYYLTAWQLKQLRQVELTTWQLLNNCQHEEDNNPNHTKFLKYT